MYRASGVEIYCDNGFDRSERGCLSFTELASASADILDLVEPRRYGQPQPGYTQQQPVYGRSPYNQSPGAPPPPPSGYGLPGYGAPAQGYGRAYEATATPYSQPPYGQHAAPYGPAGGAGGYAPAVTAPTPIQGPGYYQQQPQPSPPPPVPVAFAAGALPPPPGKYAASPTEQPPLPSAAATPPSSAAVAPRPTVSSSYTPLAATAGHPTVVSEPGAEAERDAEAVRDALRHGGSALHQTLTNLIGSRLLQPAHPTFSARSASYMKISVLVAHLIHRATF